MPRDLPATPSIVLAGPMSIVQPKTLRTSQAAVLPTRPDPHHSRLNPIALPPNRMALCPRLWVIPATVAAFSP